MVTKDNCPVCQLTEQVEELTRENKDLKVRLIVEAEARFDKAYIRDLEDERDQP